MLIRKISILVEVELCRILKKKLTKEIPSEIDLVGRVRVMQPDVNPHKISRIISCIIVYVTFS